MLKVEQLDRVVRMSGEFSLDEESDETAIATLQALATVALAEQMYNIASQMDRLAGSVYDISQKKQ